MQQNHLEPVENPEEVPQRILDLLASYQSSIVDQLLNRLKKALKSYQVRSVQISGGVSSNNELRRRSKELFARQGLDVYYPRPQLTTDNAAMIAAVAATRLQGRAADSFDLTAEPNLKVSEAKQESGAGS